MFSKIKGTEAYQIYFVRAMQNGISKFILFIFLLFIAQAYVAFVWLLSPPLQFNELSVMQGYYEGYQIGGRYSDTIKIRNESGAIENFKVGHNDYETEKILKPLKDELLKVYYRFRIDPFLYRYKNAQAIEYKNTYIYEYNSERYNRGTMGDAPRIRFLRSKPPFLKVIKRSYT